MSINITKSTCAVVLGGHVNGYSIIKELYEQGIKDLALFDYGRSLARFSNKVKYRAIIDKTEQTLLQELKKLNEVFDFIIVYPTDDLQIENLNKILDKVAVFCYLPFNSSTILKCSNKFFQYQVCESIGLPYPKTISLKTRMDLGGVEELTFPLLVKPAVRKDLFLDVFRTLLLKNFEDYESSKSKLESYMEHGIEFLISEYIPGDDTNIYAYTCFRSNEGEVLNEWTGKKLTQYPDNYGVVSSASNEAPEEVLYQGRALVSALNVYGIIEPEFKYDARDGLYKLMETNLRSMMWHRMGNICGVKLQETQYKYALELPPTTYEQEKSEAIHLVLMLHEIPNLISRKGYWKHFKYNVFGAQRREWAIFEWRDIKPFFYSLFLLARMGVAACLKRFGLR